MPQIVYLSIMVALLTFQYAVNTIQIVRLRRRIESLEANADAKA